MIDHSLSCEFLLDSNKKQFIPENSEEIGHIEMPSKKKDAC